MNLQLVQGFLNTCLTMQFVDRLLLPQSILGGGIHPIKRKFQLEELINGTSGITLLISLVQSPIQLLSSMRVLDPWNSVHISSPVTSKSLAE
jgi:hypothetical protein